MLRQPLVKTDSRLSCSQGRFATGRFRPLGFGTVGASSIPRTGLRAQKPSFGDPRIIMPGSELTLRSNRRKVYFPSDPQERASSREHAKYLLKFLKQVWPQIPGFARTKADPSMRLYFQYVFRWLYDAKPGSTIWVWGDEVGSIQIGGPSTMPSTKGLSQVHTLLRDDQ